MNFFMKLTLIVCFSFFLLIGCDFTKESKPRLAMFIGVDVSGSFLKSKYFDDSLLFLSNYIYSHMKGYGDLKKPKVLFIGSIGGVKKNEQKTFFPIQTFQDKSVKEIYKKLKEIFPENKQNPFTDFNAFFSHLASVVKKRKLLMSPISIVLISDGKPDFPGKSKKESYRTINLKPLENLSRNVTIRLLYTDAVVGSNWSNSIKRKRIKIWTQDAKVMTYWKDPKIFIPKKDISQQKKFFAWIKDNVDFSVRAKRVD